MLMRAISQNAAGAIRPRPEVELDLREVSRHVGGFRASDNVRATFELATTVVPLAMIWFLMWLALDVSYAITLLLSLPAAGLLLRLFLIQHDCGHGAFFETRRANDWLGRCIGVVTLSPYGYWRRTHAVHHAATGNLDRRGIGDVATLTVDEFTSLGRWGRLRYRIYRSPLVLFAVGPAFVFLIQHRLPIGLMRSGWAPWISTMGTNASIVLLWTTMAFLIGFGPLLLVQLPITLIAASFGVWLFYVQHQFEHAYWRGTKVGNSTTRRCMEALTTHCRQCFAGLPPISAYTTCTTYAARSLSTACRRP